MGVVIWGAGPECLWALLVCERSETLVFGPGCGRVCKGCGGAQWVWPTWGGRIQEAVWVCAWLSLLVSVTLATLPARGHVLDLKMYVAGADGAPLPADARIFEFSIVSLVPG